MTTIPLLLFALAAVALPGAGRAAQDTRTSTSGRVVATVTTLEGTVQLPGTQVDLREQPGGTVLATTLSDGNGQVSFPDVPPGRYTITAIRAGFIDSSSTEFSVRAGQVTNILLDVQLTFSVPTVDVVAKSPSPTDSVQPVSMSDMLDGSLLDSSPLEGDDFQSLMPMLPGVVRGPDGRLRVKGGQPTQAALQVSSASLNDPSTGDFDLELPAPSVESVEVLANPFAAEYGRFSTSVTQIRTRRGTNEWEVKPGNLAPRFRKGLTAIRGFEPRFSIRGPIRRDRIFLAQDFQFRYVGTPVKSLPDEPEIELTSFDSFTRIDTVVSARHTLGGGVIIFPRKIDGATMNTFRPPDVAPDFRQEGWSAGLLDRFALSPSLVLETTLAGRRFEIEVGPDGESPLIYAPQTESGNYFNVQERDVRSLQWVESISLIHNWRGEHVVKVGTDLQWARYEGESLSRPVEVRRLDGSLAERTEFAGATVQEVAGTEFSVFAQDRWRLGSRITLELGLRMDRDPIVKRYNWSPRAGAAVTVLPEGRAIIRGGFGKFVQRTALNVEAFPSFESRVVSRFGPDGITPLGPAVAFDNVIAGSLRTPEAYVGNVELNQRFGRRLLFKLGFLRRSGSHEYIVVPSPADGELQLSSTGTSGYRELEATTRYLGGARRDLTVSYVWARGTADLNNYDSFFGNIQNPLVRENQNNLSPTDVRHRVIVRGNFGLPGQWDFAPVLELRSGFPWSAVDEYQDFVGERSRAGRLPRVQTLDFQLSRPWQFRKYRFRAGLKVYNVFGSFAGRDIQNNVTAPDFGTAYNPIERSIGFVFGSAR
ncbi:MAG TPA: carboxypeptidase regulatory-like domain-containing protein [Vicinamibacterales bacterium]|nr:carboxypeptidase regulatory-like domain-containing protein [Vicinamibacterales bacterium]